MTVTPDHPDAPLVLEALARGYLRCDRLRDVLEACNLWISRQPDHPWPWLWRGGVFERLGNYHQAVADYRRALENAPEDRDVRLALGALFVRGRQPGAAVEHFEYLLDRSPEDDEALLGLASCRLEQGRPEDAVPLLERVLANDPASARGLFLRGKAALELQDAAGAQRWLAQADRQAPDDPEALHQLTGALRTQGKHAEADRLVPRLEALRQDLARLNELIRAVARNPDDAQPRHDAGVVALRLGRTDEGVRWLESALRARGDHRPTHAALAEHFRRLGDSRAEVHRRLAETP
jgi:tetratricopeptide (TPR) repeat protein